jgi:hypothetical protein
VLQVEDEVVPYRVLGLFVMPGESVPLEVLLPGGADAFVADATAGVLDVHRKGKWTWTAPDTTGLYPLVVADTLGGASVKLNAFVMRPFDHGTTRLSGYRIGRYHAKPRNNNPTYRRPTGFVEVHPTMRDVRVSPHFRLGQFLCKQVDRARTDPQYVVVRERLLLKLEMLLAAVRDAGYDAETLAVLSGFRTPYYNRSIGNRTSYSSHLYGGAADVYVDRDGDDRMDDLDGDGRVTKADARVLARLVEEMTDETWYRPFLGGLSVYGPAPHRGPFIHVDARGKRARW